jgi:hypothetical protein
VGLKVNGTQQLLVHADYVNLLGNNMNSIKKNTEALIDASKEVGLEVNTGKTMYWCFITKMQVNIRPYRQLIDASKMCQFSNILEGQ